MPSLTTNRSGGTIMANYSSIIEHMTLNRRSCGRCGNLLVRNRGEILNVWKRRKYCGMHCKVSAIASKPVAQKLNRYRVSPLGCWEWSGARTRDGYGNVTHGRKSMLAHRLSYEFHYGVAPGKLLVCHHCDNPPCIRPDHLFLGDQTANMADMARKGRSTAGRRRL